MKITRLRLSGFKSFVEPTDLTIEPGLTGVVGPNGCGKSNLLEALRWVMGENSPKSMRSSGMEDVIFSGTNARPARNSAEVLVTIDNTERLAPPQFNDTDQLEIARRIERDAGSVYRINGRDVRQRDVQLLFADASTGAHSPALVRQGQISELINMKAKSRRAILEEAAGISGLHSRRHEAELRLKAAETNLGRLNDVVQEIEGQLANLKKQARQATRYRNLSGDIRRAEAMVLHLKWSAAEEQQRLTTEKLEGVRAALAAAAEEVARLTSAREKAGEDLSPARDQEARAAAALQRLAHERETLDAEEARARRRLSEIETRLVQLRADLQREEHLGRDAAGAIERLKEESDALGRMAGGQDEARAKAKSDVDAKAADLSEKERALDEDQRALAASEAERGRLDRSIADLSVRLERLLSELQRVEGERARIQPTPDEESRLTATRRVQDEAEEELAAREKSAAEAEAERIGAQSAEQRARDPLQEAERRVSTLKAERDALVRLLKVEKSDLWPPVIDAIKVMKGYESALGAALGDELSAPSDEAAPAHWRQLPPYTEEYTLPDGVRALVAFVSAPAALARRLTQIGLVESAEAGQRLQPLLRPGQRLVTAGGDLWRWDGYRATADAPSPAAERLAQLNRLGELAEAVKSAEAQAGTLRGAYHAVRRQAEIGGQRETQSRRAAREAQQKVNEARAAVQTIERQISQSAARLSALFESERRAKEDKAEAETRLAAFKAERLALGTAEALLAMVAAKREAVGAARTELAEARGIHQSIEREAAIAAERLKRIAFESADWERRAADAEAKAKAIRERIAFEEAEQSTTAALPEAIEARRVNLLDVIATAEAERRMAADRLAEVEATVRSAEASLKAAEQNSNDLREQRARLEAQMEAIRERLGEVGGQIRETLAVEPEAVLAETQHRDGEALPALDAAEARLERYKREREALGGVNLRADEEAQEAQTRLDTLVAEKTDLEGAIQKLRAGIQSLNREGRERILAAFETVNRHFERLFTKLFEGGTAKLEMIESDDPLEAGLEIMARPPGKRLQSLSLLSGGEQALTAMALIFAVFLSNPAPICVLDEVDAPLDDANVDRFCNLLNEMARISNTRFLVITHHPVTMSRMDRLYGVTMQERGVSQLVSVDLTAAAQLHAAD